MGGGDRSMGRPSFGLVLSWFRGGCKNLSSVNLVKEIRRREATRRVGSQGIQRSSIGTA